MLDFDPVNPAFLKYHGNPYPNQYDCTNWLHSEGTNRISNKQQAYIGISYFSLYVINMLSQYSCLESYMFTQCRTYNMSRIQKRTLGDINHQKPFDVSHLPMSSLLCVFYCMTFSDIM